MRTRTYGLLVLALVGVVPLASFGYLAIERAERTAVTEVRAGNRQLAESVAERIAAFANGERQLLGAIGAAAVLAPTPESAQAILNAYELDHRHYHQLAVYRNDGTRIAGPEDAEARALAEEAAGGETATSDVRLAEEDAAGAFSHSFTLAEPVVVAGAREGVIVAQVDLVGVWRPVNRIQVGSTGFARLLDLEGHLLAHGNPEERRFVFDGVPEKNARLVAGALLGRVVENQRGQDVVATAAFVPGLDWLVVVEQQVAEAFGPARELARELLVWSAVAVVAAIAIGLLGGRTLVRPLERLRAHTRVLARGELEARAEPRSNLVEARALADSLNEMAASLSRLQEEAKQRERLTTFSRVAAGLAHDLRQPIEAVRAACDALVHHPDEPGARALLDAVNRRDLPRLKRYVDDLHRLARTGEMSLELQELVPEEVAATVAETLGTMPKWRGVAFSVAGTSRPVDADLGLVKRAVTNLASNGADACAAQGPGGAVTIEVADAAGEDAVEFRITDTGAGIEPDRVADLFHADFKSTKRSTGVGLGLGVVRQVADSHGGTLDVESELGRGSTFTIRIPRRPSHRPVRSGESATGPEDESKGQDYGTRKAEVEVG